MIRKVKALFNRLFRREEIEVNLKEMHYSEDVINAMFQTSAAPWIAAELTKFFISQGGVNYVSMGVFDAAEMVRYQVIVQKMGRPDMSEVNIKMRNALHDIYDDPDNARVIASKTLLELGYFDH